MKNRQLSLLAAGIILSIVTLLNGCGKRLPTTIDAGQGYQRTVLVELFTSEFCTNCPKADSAAERLAAEMGDTLCLVEFHTKYFLPGDTDTLGLTSADELTTAYQAPGLPFFSCDGLDTANGANTVDIAYQVYRQKADLRKQIFSPLKLSLNAQLDQNVITYTLKIDSDASLSQGSNLGLVLVVVEDSVNAYGKVFRYVARLLTPSIKGDSLDIQPASSMSRSGAIARNAGWLPWRLSLIAYVRNNDTREVLQAAKARIYAAVTAPATPVLNLPANDAVGQSLSPTLSWLASGGAASYTLQYDTDSLFAGGGSQSGLTGTSFRLSGLANSTTYYWRVNASNNAGTSLWSSWRRFTTTATTLPAAPVLASPDSGANDISRSPVLAWNSVPGAGSYDVQVAADNSFAPAAMISEQYGSTATSFTVLGLDSITTYHWRVRAGNAAGLSAWSKVWSFTTTFGYPPAVPTLIAPLNGELNAGVSPVLSWSSSLGATRYSLQVSPYSDFKCSLYDQTTITGTSQTVNGLDSLTTYHWRVNAANASGTSDWSTAWKFTDARGYGFSRVITPDSITWLPDTIISYSLSDPEAPELGYHIFLTNLSAKMNIYAQAPTVLNSDSLLFWGYICTETGCMGPNSIASAAFNAGATQHWTVHFNFSTLPPPEGLHFLTLKLWAADNPSHIMTRKLYLEVLP